MDLSPDRGDEAAKFREWFRIRCQEGESRRSGVNRGGPAWLGSLCLKRWWPQRDLIELAQFKCAISLRVDSRLRSAGASALNHSPNGRTGNTSHRQIPLGHHCVTALPADRVPKHDSLVTVIESDCNSLGFSAVGTFYRACSYAGRDCRGRGGSGRREGSCHAARRAPMLRGNTPRRFPHRIGRHVSRCPQGTPRTLILDGEVCAFDANRWRSPRLCPEVAESNRVDPPRRRGRGHKQRADAVATARSGAARSMRRGCADGRLAGGA